MMNFVAHKPAVVWLACCILGLTQTSRAAEEWRASRTWIAGTDTSVWVIGAEDGSGESSLPTLQMWQAQILEDKPILPKQTRFLPAVVGSPKFLGADANALRAMFGDLSTWSYYSDRDSAPWVNWRDVSNEPPLAWAGDAAEPVVWVLARTPSLLPEKPPAAAGQSASTTRPGDVESGATHLEDATDAIPAGLTLLHYQNGTWHRIRVLIEAEDGLTFWLSARQGQAHLFWQDASRTVFAASWSRSDAWSPPKRVNTEGDLRVAWAGACELGPVFIAGVEQGASGDRGSVQIQLHAREADGWSGPRRVSEGTEYLALDPSRACVSIAGNRIIVARPAADGTVQFGTAELGLSPSVRFATLQIRQEFNTNEMTWFEMISLVLMLVLMTLIFRSRREQMARPAITPKGFVVASVWRRILATFIDLAPASAVASQIAAVICGQSVFETLQRLWAGGTPEPADLVCAQVSWLLSVFLYGVWCCVWELTIRSTPGKLIFGCRVAGLFGQRPTTRQILARNAMRVMVFALGEPGLIVTLMAMVLVGRNRQRLGDILADTIVIEPAPPAEGTPNDDIPSSQ